MKLLMAVTCSAALLVACASGSGRGATPNTTPATASTSTAAPEPTSTVVDAPVTTITVETVAPTSPTAEPAAVSAPATTPPTLTATTTPKTTTPKTTTPKATASTPVVLNTTAPASTTIASTGSSSAGTGASNYAEVAPPKVPSVTAAVPADNSHPDGVYYATATEGTDTQSNAGTMMFELTQLFRGDACTKHFGAENQDSCLNDYGVEAEPTATIAVPLADQYISVSDAATQKSIKINGIELYSLIHGDVPSAGAPSGYTYVGFGFMMTISSGKVTRLEQWWTP